MAETNNKTENVKLGVCSVTFGGVNLGFTKGGVEVTVETETHEVTVDQMGNTPINEYITARTCTVTVPLAETTLENLVKIMPGATLVTDSTEENQEVCRSSCWNRSVFVEGCPNVGVASDCQCRYRQI